MLATSQSSKGKESDGLTMDASFNLRLVQARWQAVKLLEQAVSSVILAPWKS